jgi:hypothetical protein
MPKTKKIPASSQLVQQMADWADKEEVAGLTSGAATLNLLNHAVSAAFLGTNASSEMREWKQQAILATIKAMAPRDAIEGQLIAQMIATNEAAMECLRRAALLEQTFEARQSALGLANKLLRAYAMQVKTLNRHRGKGQQTVRVEHVTVQAGGQAIVGNVEAGGGGDGRQIEHQPHAPVLADAGLPMLWSEDQTRDSVSGTSGTGQEALPDAWRREG